MSENCPLGTQRGRPKVKRIRVYADVIALSGIRLISTYFRTALHDLGNIAQLRVMCVAIHSRRLIKGHGPRNAKALNVADSQAVPAARVPLRFPRPPPSVSTCKRSAIVRIALIIRCCSGSRSAFITKLRSILIRLTEKRRIEAIEALPVPKSSKVDTAAQLSQGIDVAGDHVIGGELATTVSKNFH